MNNPWLEFAWLRLRGKLETLAETKSQSLDGYTSHGKAESSTPTLDSDLAHFDKRWRRCCSDEDRRSMLLCVNCTQEDAKASGHVRCCLIGLLRSYLIAKPDPRTRRGTQEWRREVAEKEGSAALVARAYGIRKAQVHSCRREFGLERAHGGARNGAGRPTDLALLRAQLTRYGDDLRDLAA